MSEETVLMIPAKALERIKFLATMSGLDDVARTITVSLSLFELVVMMSVEGYTELFVKNSDTGEELPITMESDNE